MNGQAFSVDLSISLSRLPYKLTYKSQPGAKHHGHANERTVVELILRFTVSDKLYVEAFDAS